MPIGRMRDDEKSSAPQGATPGQDEETRGLIPRMQCPVERRREADPAGALPRGAERRESCRATNINAATRASSAAAVSHGQLRR